MGMLMMMISTDDDTKVSIDAVVDFFVKGPEDDPKAAYKMMFRMIDLNKDGTISKEELAKYFKMEGGFEEFVLKEMMKEADKDKDGKLNFAEFCVLMEKSNSRHCLLYKNPRNWRALET